MTRTRYVVRVAAFAVALTTAGPAGAAFVGTNGRISYDRWLANAHYDVYAVNPDGTAKRGNLYGDGQLSVFNPAYSPDGRKLAVSYIWPAGRGLRGELVVENDDPNRNGYDGHLVVARSWGVPWEPSWSPDGTRLVFTSNRDGDYELYAVSATGGTKTRLTRNRVPDGEASWSPDGRRIAFVRIVNRNRDVYVLDLVRGRTTRLTRTARDEGNPAWSPDGRKIVFWGEGRGDSELFVIDVATKRVRQVTRTAAYEYDPAWSPDGTSLAYARWRSGRWDILTLPVVGGTPRNLTRDRAPDILPDWQPGCTRTGVADVPSEIVGSDEAELICGLGQAETVYGNGGNDSVFGREGDDSIDGGDGDDVLVGGPGADTLTGGVGGDLLNALDGTGGDVVNGDAEDLCYADPADLITGCTVRALLPGTAVMSRAVLLDAQRPSRARR